jgi:uncharacterized cupin superfamily protein
MTADSPQRFIVQDKDRFIHYHFNVDDINTEHPDRPLSRKFETGQGLLRVAAPPDLELRAGFTKYGPGHGTRTFFWYKEIWYVIYGTATMTVTDKRLGEEYKVTLREGDFCYFPIGTRVEMTCDAGTDFHWLWCAVPASKKLAPWLAVMDERDINDVKLRDEYAPRDV